MLGFKIIGIWPFNPKVMNAKTRSVNIYITMNSNHEAEGEGHYTLDDKVGPNQQEEQETIAIEFFNMVGIVIKSNTKCHQEEHKHQYYVEMPHNPPSNNVEHEEHVINLDYPTPTFNT